MRRAVERCDDGVKMQLNKSRSICYGACSSGDDCCATVARVAYFCGVVYLPQPALSPPRGAGWEPGSAASRAKKSPRDATSAITVRLFKPSARPQQRKVLALGITLSPGYASAGG